jgi:hypothetical protein
MSGKDISISTVDYGDIQGVVRFGYRALSEACFLYSRSAVLRTRVSG